MSSELQSVSLRCLLSSRSIAEILKIVNRNLRAVLLPVITALLVPVASITAMGPASGTITGIVTDSASGRPLSGASIVVVGQRAVSVSRNDGSFTITGLATGSYSLEVRRVGYAPLTIPAVVVTDNAQVSVVAMLRTAILQLSELVTTGVADPIAGTSLPFSVSRLDTTQLGAVSAANAVAQLQGKVAGLAMTGGAAPGSAPDIQLRSPASIFKSTMPLIVVDGIVLSQTNPALADLQSLDLESAEVVKGAAAASLYGSRAANGVISFRSRRGTSLARGVTQFTLRNEFGVNSIARTPPTAKYHAFRLNDAGQYVDAAGAVVTRDARVELPDSIRFQDQSYPGGVTDQLDRFFTGSAYASNSLSIGRNNGTSSWRALISSGSNSGVVPMDGGYRRKDLRLALDQQFTTALRLSATASYMKSDQSVIDEGENSPFFDLINQAPDVNLRLRDADGTPYIFLPDSTSQGARPNPLYTLAVRDWNRERTRMLGNLDLSWTPLPWLTLSGTVSHDEGNERERFYFPRDAKSAIQSLQTGLVERSTNATSASNGALSLRVVRSLGKLTARTTARTLFERESQEGVSVASADLSVAGVPGIGVGQSVSGSSLTTSIRTNAALLSTALDYDSRFTADLLWRRDGSSLFGEAQRWQDYYRVSGAWRLAQEAWWPFAAIHDFKVRASHGTAGGRPSFSDQYETYTITTGGIPVKRTLGNPGLLPEHAVERDVGLDMAFGNRASVQFTRAWSTVHDQLVEVPLSAAAGFLSQWQNAGTVRGNSTELTLQLQLVTSGAFTWSTSIVADRSRNMIDNFDRSCFRTGTVGYRCAGVPIGAMYGATFITSASQLPALHAGSVGMFRVNSDGLLVPTGNAAAGERHWGENVTIDGVEYAWGMPLKLKAASGADSIVMIGNGAPDLHIGWSNSIGWRSFTIYTLVDAQIGGDVYNRTRQRMYQYYRSGDVDQAGVSEADKKPTQYYSVLYNANSVADWFVEKGGYVKLRELSVRYRVPVSGLRLFDRQVASGVSVALTGRNLLTLTSYSGFDPEVGRVLDRVDQFGYPMFRTISGSLTVDF